MILNSASAGTTPNEKTLIENSEMISSVVDNQKLGTTMDSYLKFHQTSKIPWNIKNSTEQLEHSPTWHGPDFTCNFPQTVLRPTETDQSQIYPKTLYLLCFDSHVLVNISRCSSQHLSVISSKHCLCLHLEPRPTGTAVRLKNLDYLGLKTQTLPDHSLKNVRWANSSFALQKAC